jgi:hypothetical protein
LRTAVQNTHGVIMPNIGTANLIFP